MNCSRCGADRPPTDRYCGQCGNTLEEPSRLQRSTEAVGWLVMASGLIVLVLAALYYAAQIMINLWSVGEPLYDLIFPVGHSISGQSFQWPGLTVGALLGVLGIMISVWSRGQLPRASGRGARVLFLIGGAVVLIGAIIGAFPTQLAQYLEGETGSIVMGIYSRGYMAVVLTGLAIVLAGMVWASWKDRRWGIPSASAAVKHDAADEKRVSQ